MNMERRRGKATCGGNNAEALCLDQANRPLNILLSSDSHLMGMFYRTLRMVDNGIKPVYVFDGKPPTLKSGEVTFFRFS